MNDGWNFVTLGHRNSQRQYSSDFLKYLQSCVEDLDYLPALRRLQIYADVHCSTQSSRNSWEPNPIRYDWDLSNLTDLVCYNGLPILRLRYENLRNLSIHVIPSEFFDMTRQFLATELCTSKILHTVGWLGRLEILALRIRESPCAREKFHGTVLPSLTTPHVDINHRDKWGALKDILSSLTLPKLDKYSIMLCDSCDACPLFQSVALPENQCPALRHLYLDIVTCRRGDEDQQAFDIGNIFETFPQVHHIAASFVRHEICLSSTSLPEGLLSLELGVPREKKDCFWQISPVASNQCPTYQVLNDYRWRLIGNGDYRNPARKWPWNSSLRTE